MLFSTRALPPSARVLLMHQPVQAYFHSLVLPKKKLLDCKGAEAANAPKKKKGHARAHNGPLST
jgi:hypothetical protein